MTTIRNTTTVVNLNLQPYDARIDRKTIFGNPYKLEIYGRKRCIQLFRHYFFRRLETDAEFKKSVLGLRGKRLGCHCKTPDNPDNPCHGDVYAEYLNNYDLIKEARSK